MIYVLGDVHGSVPRYRSILSQIALTLDDHLYILGDVIDRHDGGIEILQEIANMRNATMLLGNHEYMMLNAVTPENEKLPWKRSSKEWECYTWFRNGGKRTLDAYQKLSPAEQKTIRDYLISLPLNKEISVNGIEFKLVHAAPIELFYGHYCKYSSDYVDSTAFALWHRFDDFTDIPKKYVMIFGHTPTCSFQSNQTLSIWHGDGVIGIDCGSGFPPKPTVFNHYQGRLASLRLNDMHEFYSDV